MSECDLETPKTIRPWANRSSRAKKQSHGITLTIHIVVNKELFPYVSRVPKFPPPKSLEATLNFE